MFFLFIWIGFKYLFSVSKSMNETFYVDDAKFNVKFN